MPDLFLCEAAEDDLKDLLLKDENIASKILVILQELQEDDDLLDRLTQHDYGHPMISDFHVSKWFAQWNKGKDLWRLKIWELDNIAPKNKYRIIYAYMPLKNCFYVLAIAPREFNYDEKHPISQRIIDEYQNLCGF
ncbi:MAG: hypothetical protein HOM14_08525 [Gammaproteobacteria bacterium]|nr:hypothetical protein [Gammaproteobacteria bacterium]MBT4863400.1 hypothetical protein [Gammaproteobacteria bacterium]MBT6551384.1 hypothetical protein [Gammaproteobacteria bacterium]MBT6701459.1 hypothetical protein [Gammaproteobacteria bacterium]